MNWENEGKQACIWNFFDPALHQNKLNLNLIIWVWAFWSYDYFNCIVWSLICWTRSDICLICWLFVIIATCWFRNKYLGFNGTNVKCVFSFQHSVDIIIFQSDFDPEYQIYQWGIFGFYSKNVIFKSAKCAGLS